MTNQLSTVEQAGIFFPGVELKPTRLILDDLNQTQWRDCGAFLSHLQGATMFWIGDWVSYGEKNWGETYQELIEATGYDYGTLRNAASVCKAVNCHVRRDKLSFAHHAEVAKLDEFAQKDWLKIAEERSLTVRELRASIKAGKVVREDELSKSNKSGVESIEKLPLEISRIYRATFGQQELESCDNAQRLRTWIDSTQPAVELNTRARLRLQELGE